MSLHKLLKYQGKLGITTHFSKKKNYQQTSAQKLTVRSCCHFTLGEEPPLNNSWFVGFFSCGWGFQKRDPWHPCPVRPFPACGRPTPLRGQEIWWTWCPISLPEVLPLNFPFTLSWSSIKCINLMELVLVIFVWIEWSVPTCLCLEDNWVIWYPDLLSVLWKRDLSWGWRLRQRWGTPLGWGLTSPRLLLESVLCGWNYGYAHTCIYIGETVMKLYSRRHPAPSTDVFLWVKF